MVGIAWLAQSRIVDQLKQEQERSTDLLREGSPAMLEEPGWGHVILGRPSGAPPLEQPPRLPDPAATTSKERIPPPPGDSAPAPAPAPRWPADLELVVRPGQSLSKIAAAEYDRATDELVQALARYNGLDDPNKLRAGRTLRVPVKDKLLHSE